MVAGTREGKKTLRGLLPHCDGFRWLNKACQDRCFELLSMRVDPRLDAVRSDLRFDEVAKQMGLA